MNRGIDTAKLVRWYDFQARFYALWRNRLDSPLVAVVASTCRRVPGARRILDAGCGTGLFSLALAHELPEAQVTGVDLSSGMLAVAAGQSRRHDLRNLRFVRANVAALPFSADSFDLVVAAGLLPNVSDERPVLAQLARVLSSQGRIVVVEFDRASLGLARRLFFAVMIFGYKAVSFFFRRFRFAERWDLCTSTIDREAFERQLAPAGLEPVSIVSRHGHLVFELRRGSPP